MAQTKSGADAPSKQMTAAEMQQWIEEHERQLKNYDLATDPLRRLRDVAKGSRRRIDSLRKDSVIAYLQNPTSNEANLRNVSWYLFYRNMIYQRLITYYSSLFCLEARSIIPPYNLVNPIGDDVILKSYNDTVQMLSRWNINNEFLKVITTCFLQDVSYNVAYYDSTGLYLLPIPAEYCRIYAQYPTGDYAFAIDMNYFRGTNNWLVEAWGEPFITMYRQYVDDGNTARWQVVPDEYAACFKYHNEDWETIMPVFAGLFSDLINLNDISDIAAVADKLDVYKLLIVKLETITGAKMPDEWKVNPEIVIEYFNRMIDEALPDYVSAAISPADVDVIDFSNLDKANETNKVLKTTKSVLNSSGGAQILNSADITGTTAFHASLHADENFAMSTLLPQINGWFNRVMGYVVSNPSKIKFYFVGRFTRDEFRKELLENAQYSLPTKLAVMSLSGIDELDTLSLNHLEENILKLSEKLINPLKSSHTSSSDNEVGRPSSDETELTDDGEASRDKTDNRG